MKKLNKIIIANWKMNLNHDQSVEVAKKLKILLSATRIGRTNKVVVCPDHVSLSDVAKIFRRTRIGLGAQDGFYLDKGAFTGEVSLKELKESKCQFVILGHSERRAMGESDKTINKKLAAALKHKITPILCVGEKASERKKGQHDKVVINQVTKALENIKLKTKQKIIVAYEPIWAISPSKKIVEPKEAARMCRVVMKAFSSVVGKNKLSSLLTIYGGSVDPKNVNSFTSFEEVRGVLVGSASLKSESFVKIIKNS